jgi:hypothetical protein
MEIDFQSCERFAKGGKSSIELAFVLARYIDLQT